MTMETCKHRRTTYNEQDGSLYCEQCHSWVLPKATMNEPLPANEIRGKEQAITVRDLQRMTRELSIPRPHEHLVHPQNPGVCMDCGAEDPR